MSTLQIKGTHRQLLFSSSCYSEQDVSHFCAAQGCFEAEALLTCSVGGVCDHGEDVLEDVTEIGLVEALGSRLLLSHVLQQGVKDLQSCTTGSEK